MAAILMGISACSGKKAEQQGAAPQVPAFVQQTAPQGAYAPAGDSLYAYVERQLAFGPRNPGSKGAGECARWIVEELRGHGADTVLIHPFTASTEFGGPYAMRNILGRFNPDAQARVLLLAHYDTRPVADQDEQRTSEPIPGANDGASGVAVLLETARLLGQTPLPKDVGVDLLFIDGEDSGNTGGGDDESWCLGTQRWVEEAMPYTPATRPQTALLFDMVGGTGATFAREQISDLYARQLGDRVCALAAQMDLADRFPNRRGGAVVDDHLYINRAGIPCVDIIESANPQTGSFPPHWHTHADNLSVIDPATLAAAARMGVAVILTTKP